MTKTDNLDKIYLDYANFVITNNYWFRYTDIAIDLGISLSELCEALGITYEIINNGTYFYYDTISIISIIIRAESDNSINHLDYLIYEEYSNGYWSKTEYDDTGNIIYKENSNGYWCKFDFDNNGNLIYKEVSNGYWVKLEYDENGNQIYEENSNGYWYKWVYDENSNKIYEEHSDGYWCKYNENGETIEFGLKTGK